MKVYKKITLILSFIIALIILPSFSLAEEGLIHAPCAIQVSSVISDGRMDIFDIAKVAKNNAIKVVIITDRDFMHWQ